MKIQELLDKLGKEMGSDKLKLDENGGCTLVFDNRLDVCLETAPEDNILHVYAVLCPIPQTDRESVYDVLMEGHLFGYGSGDATFGASPKLGNILLFRNFDLQEISYKGFIKALEKFVNAFETWKHRIENPQKVGAE